MLVALVLPFGPVSTEQTTVVWPAPGHPVRSSMALFVPYRPAELTVTVPCSALRAAAGQDHAVTVLATGPPSGGLVLRTETGTARLMLGPRLVRSIPVAGTTTDCRTRLHAGPGGTVITTVAGRLDLAGEPVPEVFAFHTDLDAAQAAGMVVTARTASPFATSPTGLKILLITVQLLAVFIALGLLADIPACRALLLGVSRFAARAGSINTDLIKIVWVDAGVVGVLIGWAIIGPLTDDDGFATTIARNAALTGNVGNYYRWWNASETPFALTEQLLAPLTQVSLAPLWLRLPSTVLGIATWFVVSRGVLGAALAAAPKVASVVRIRLLAAVCLLATWLPFNLGVRPEPYVAFGITTVLALLYRARGLPSLGWAALVTGLTIPVSPSGLLVAAPIVIFAPRIVAVLRASAPGGAEVLARVLLLCCIGAVGLTVIFADQTWGGLVTATRWHNFFGPSLPWYHEPDRYRFLLSADQDGTATKRIPVLVTLALLPVVAVLVARRRAQPDDTDRAAGRLAAVVAAALALLWLTPSKWSHHFGALAGLFACFLVVAVVLLLRRSRAPSADRVTMAIGVAGAVLVAGAAGLAFTGPNAWWQPAVYDVPWANGPVRPIGIPLDSALLWLGVAALVTLATRRLLTAPAILTLAVASTAVLVLLGSFLAAPVRRPAGSLALANLHQLGGGRSCGLADGVQVLPDGAVLAPADESGYLAGFTALGGYDPGSPPPDPSGTGTSAQLWGSLGGGPRNTGILTSPWFTLPPLGSSGGVAVSVSGRTDRGNKLALEFGSTVGTQVVPRGTRIPFDLVKPNQDRLDGPPEYRPWRSIGVDAAQVPAGANRVRIRAIDATTDPDGWLAVTGPRLRSVVGLTQFLAGRGPVLVSWPLAFLFPCVHNIVGVADGLAATPAVVIEAPRRFGRLSAVSTDPTQGGVFAGLRPFGQLHDIPTRLAGHPDVDWGTLQLNATRDTYLSRYGDISGVKPGSITPICLHIGGCPGTGTGGGRG
ncbi:MAG TPA: arabinosyltransferase domain-containing protein [Pseudonocardiaceae bacterium]|nr:arabinosyltransferase domain-containing protein [Pseudonocardiaceae bacterium]